MARTELDILQLGSIWLEFLNWNFRRDNYHHIVDILVCTTSRSKLENDFQFSVTIQSYEDILLYTKVLHKL